MARIKYRPVVDSARCEGKAACVVVCPVNVFEVRAIDDEAYQALTMLGRLKSWVHGGKMAYTPRADACEVCGLCVGACPEGAISLIREGGG